MKHVKRRARFQHHGDASCHQVFFFLQGKAPKGIHPILTETLGEHAASYATVKNWAAQFKRGFPPVMRLVLDDPKQWPPRRLLIKFTS